MVDFARTGAVGFVLLLASASLYASGPVDIFEFSNPGQKVRYKSLIEEFRCPKCLNINIAGSDAPIAQDLRRTVHRLLVEEKMNDDEIRIFLRDRYGDFVLYDPPLNQKTWLIWVMPILFLLAGVFFIFFVKNRANGDEPIKLSNSDHEKLKNIVDGD